MAADFNAEIDAAHKRFMATVGVAVLPFGAQAVVASAWFDGAHSALTASARDFKRVVP